MSYVEAIVLGIIQGLTEFLPISSSGHLEIVKTLFGNQAEAQESLFLTIALHVATAFSTIVVFRKDILEIIKGLFVFKLNESTEFSFKIILSMIPAVLVGLFLQDQIELLFAQNLILVGAMLCLTAIILFWADKAKKTDKIVSSQNAIVLGIVQAIAILPGISRSGSTIATAVLLGIDREKAARFSFLMVLPLIFGSMAKTILDADGVRHKIEFLPLFFGFFAAFFTGILACKWMIALVKKSQLKYFSLYCIIVGGIALVYGLL
jgi:undecaprenyl-diphosphatase